jgi:hypothetical protein
MVTFILVGWQGVTLADVNSPSKATNYPDKISSIGPELSKEELARIAKLNTAELADMLKTGDMQHRYAALNRLRAGDGWKRNFNLLMSIAEKGGDLIVRGFFNEPIKPTAPDEDKRLVDKFLDFLEAQLKKDKPSVSHTQAVESIGRTVHIASAFTKTWRPRKNLHDPPDPNKLVVPYANARVLGILTRCLDSKDWQVRWGAILWLGSIGANDLTKADDVLALLKAQLSKEETSKEGENIKETMIRNTRNAIGRLNREVKFLRYGMPKYGEEKSESSSEFSPYEPNK